MRVSITKLLGAEHCTRDVPNQITPFLSPILFIYYTIQWISLQVLKIIFQPCLSQSSSTEQTGKFFLPNSLTRTSVSLVVKFFRSRGISLKIYCQVEVRAGLPDSWPLVDLLDLSAEVFPLRTPFMGFIFWFPLLWQLHSEND